MLREERFHRICGLIGALHWVSTDRIASELGVSRETVRRDILDLEARGLLRRAHGRVLAPGPESEQREKQSIAKAALRLIKPGQTLFIDAGSTVSILAEELAALSGLMIITNSVDVAMKIGRVGSARNNEVQLLGGRFGEAVPATFGGTTIAEIHRYRADIALLSPVGISAEKGATSFDLAEAEVARAMAQSADRVVILADHSKIGVVSRAMICPVDRIDVLVTDPKGRESTHYDALATRISEVVSL
jgi:DeoR/GlpR family transcriptional regulator of sugar metabolism